MADEVPLPNQQVIRTNVRIRGMVEAHCPLTSTRHVFRTSTTNQTTKNQRLFLNTSHACTGLGLPRWLSTGGCTVSGSLWFHHMPRRSGSSTTCLQDNWPWPVQDFHQQDKQDLRGAPQFSCFMAGGPETSPGGTAPGRCLMLIKEVNYVSKIPQDL